MKRFLVLSLLMALSGCATVITGPKQPVNINSIPPNAIFTITNEQGTIVQTGTTPEMVVLNSGKPYFNSESYVVNYKKGDMVGKSVIDTTINKWYFGNILLGGFVGMLIIDPLTGAMWDLPETSSAILEVK